MTTATLSSRVVIDGSEQEIAVDYDYDPRDRELVVESAMVGDKQVWAWLTEKQREKIREECVTDYYDRMERDPRRVRGQRS